MIDSIREVSSWLGILGIPSIFVMTSWCINSCVKFFRELKILQEAQKAQMRGQLLDRYYVIKERGFIWDDEITEWTNQYDAYHVLKGPNEVLDARKDELLAMPSKKR